MLDGLMVYPSKGIKKGFRGPELESIPHLPTAGALFSQTSINYRGSKTSTIGTTFRLAFLDQDLFTGNNPFSYFISLLTQCSLCEASLHWLGKKVSAVGVNRENGPSLMRSYISFRNSSLFQQRPKKTESQSGLMPGKDLFQFQTLLLKRSIFNRCLPLALGGRCPNVLR